MFCLHCGNVIEEGDTFCENCGQKIDAPKYTPCVHCGQLSDDVDAFCEFCGKKVSEAGAALQQQRTAVTSYTPTAPMAKTAPPMRTSPSVPSSQPRMPLIFLIDTSAPATPYINQLIVHLSKFIIDVCADTVAQNTLDMAIIQFNDRFAILQDLPDVTNTNLPQLTAGGNACYSAPIREALRMAEEYSLNQTKSHKPWVIMITSSEPSDDITAVAVKVQSIQRADKLRFMALGVMDYNAAALKNITDVVFRQKGEDFTSFFEWIRKCISTIVRTKPGEKPQLPQLEGNVYRDK